LLIVGNSAFWDGDLIEPFLAIPMAVITIGINI